MEDVRDALSRADLELEKTNCKLIVSTFFQVLVHYDS